MAEKAPIHLRGIEGKADSNGKVSRTGCKAVVVSQASEADEPLPLFYASSVEDAREYLRSQSATGNGAGLRIVKPEDV